MMKRTFALSLVAALACVLGCKHEAPAIGRLDIQPHTVSLGYPELTMAHVTFSPSGGPDAEALAPADGSRALLFVHLLDAQGAVLRTFDRPLRRSEDVRLYQSALAPPLDPGKYRLSVGIYDHNGKRYPLEGLGKPIGRSEYVAAEIDVPPQAAGPRFSFSSAWEPIEAGTDKQVVARRWLADQPGEVHVDAIPGAGSLWLRFRIPAGNAAGEKLVLHDPAANSPAVVVGGTCGTVEASFSGPGYHAVEIPVDAATAQKGCLISLAPNFHVISTNRPELRSLTLDVAAWIPAGSRAASASPDGDKNEP